MGVVADMTHSVANITCVFCCQHHALCSQLLCGHYLLVYDPSFPFSLLKFESVLGFSNGKKTSPCSRNYFHLFEGTNARNGTCYTSTECSSRGGSASGSCASSFGKYENMIQFCENERVS